MSHYKALYKSTDTLLYFMTEAGEKNNRQPKINKISCRWQTCATRCITANVLQTNKVDAQCDKLAAELGCQRFSSKVTIFSYRTCI